jgi:hypothetical protein
VIWLVSRFKNINRIFIAVERGKQLSKALVSRTVFLGLLVLFLSACNGERSQPREDIYPWQISVQADGKTRVFGITLNESRLLDAAGVLDRSYELGLFEAEDQPLSLEAYFSEVTLGGISGKFILTLEVSQAELTILRDRAVKRKVLESGARRYTVTYADKMALSQKTITSLAYIPYINLNEEIINSRFGEPAERIVIDQKMQHLLFPELGLDLLLDDDGKELLQYVLPTEFDKLRQPLLDKYSG